MVKKDIVLGEGTDRRAFIKKAGAATLFSAATLNTGYANPFLLGEQANNNPYQH